MDTILGQFLKELESKVGLMAGVVEDSLQLSVKALASKDASLFPKVFDNEERINGFHKEISHDVFKLLARQSPVASDLRLILSVSKIVVDLERMGDLSRSNSYCIQDYFKESPVILATEIPKMADLVRSMVRKSADAFLMKDIELASEVLQIDDSVDTFRDSLVANLVAHMKIVPTAIDACLYLLTVIRNLERIGDHSTNIAEDVIFSLTGEDIKHEKTFRSLSNAANGEGS